MTSNTIHKILEEAKDKFVFKPSVVIEDITSDVYISGKWIELKAFLLFYLTLIQIEERAFVGKNKREWYQRGIREGAKEEREKLNNILNSYPPRPTEWENWTTDIQQGYCKGEVSYKKYILSQLEKEEK